MTALLRLHWQRHRRVLAALGLGLFAFQWLLTRLMPGPEQAALMRQLFDLLPGPMATMFADELPALLTPAGFLAFGYRHPFTLVLLGSWAIRVPAGALAGEIGAGTMDLLAARPVRRGTLVGAGLLVTLAGLAVLLGAGFAGTALGLASRPVPGLRLTDLAGVMVTCGALFSAFGCLAMLLSATQRAGGPAITLATALLAGSFALDYVARAWAPLGWARPLSLFTYFDTTGIPVFGLRAADLALLGGVSLVSAAAAGLIFERRDL